MIKVMWGHTWEQMLERKRLWRERSERQAEEIETLKSTIRDYERKMSAKNAELDNLQAELSKSQRNDSPKDTKSGKFIKKKGAK